MTMNELKALVEAYGACAYDVSKGWPLSPTYAAAFLHHAESLFDLVDFGSHPELRRTVAAIRGAISSTEDADTIAHLERALHEANARLVCAMVNHINRSQPTSEPAPQAEAAE